MKGMEEGRSDILQGKKGVKVSFSEGVVESNGQYDQAGKAHLSAQG